MQYIHGIIFAPLIPQQGGRIKEASNESNKQIRGDEDTLEF